MGIVYVPAGEEERYIRHLLAAVEDPTLVTTSHERSNVVFYAPDEAIDALNEALKSGQDAPEWGNGAPALLTRTDETAQVTEPKRKGRPPGSSNKKNSTD